jgi:hypothetical protein
MITMTPPVTAKKNIVDEWTENHDMRKKRIAVGIVTVIVSENAREIAAAIVIEIATLIEGENMTMIILLKRRARGGLSKMARGRREEIELRMIRMSVVGWEGDKMI